MKFQISKLSLPLVMIPTLLTSNSAFAFLDFAGQAAKDAAKSAIYANSIVELVNELDDSNEIGKEARRLSDRMTKLKTEASDIYFMSSEFQDLSRGPDWTSNRLDENIRYTSRYIQRLKRMMVTMGLVGTDVATAMNTAETNGALKEVLKNQQAQLLLEKEQSVNRAETELSDKKAWEKFISHEHEVRSGQGSK